MMNLFENTYAIYLGLHLFAMVAVCVTITLLIIARPSRAQLGSVLFGIAALVYMFGFLTEITTDSLEMITLAIKIEYLGECFLVLGFTWFISEFCHFFFPRILYIFELIVSIISLAVIFTFEHHTFFYTGMSLNTSGPFSRVELHYGIGFYLFTFYLFVASAISFGICVFRSGKSVGIERKRIRLIEYALICPWLPPLLRELGLTGGYEISFLGILGATLFIATALVHYGYFDSVQLAEENILYHSHEGLIVTDVKKRILYYNKMVQQLFPKMKKYSLISDYPELGNLFHSTTAVFSHQNHYFESRFEPLVESGYVQGYLLRILDMTEHYEKLHAAELSAHVDALTGLSDRSRFRHTLLHHIQLGGSGAMLMLDLDNFKQINDTYGHGTGDNVLLALSNSIKTVVPSPHLSCRIGGDEFCIFFKDVTDSSSLTKECEQLAETFRNFLASLSLQEKATLSIGVAVTDDSFCDCDHDVFDELYRRADRALYASKSHGKNTYHFYHQNTA